MTEFTWNSPTSGDWFASADWDGGVAPDDFDANAVIAADGSYTVQIASADTVTVGALALNATGATLDVAGMLTLGGGTLGLSAGTLLLDAGGVVASGTIDAMGGALAAQDGTLSGVTFLGVLALTGDQQALMLQDGLVLSDATGTAPGSIDLSGATNSSLLLLDDETLDNAILNFGTGVANTVATGLGSDSSQTLTLGTAFTITVSGGNGFLGYQPGSGAASDTRDSLNNTGLMAVDGGSLEIGYGGFNNAGKISIDAGTLQVDSAGAADIGSVSVTDGGVLDLLGTLSTAQLAGITAAGGTLEIGGVLDNTGQTLTVGPGSLLGAVLLSGTIIGGVINDSGARMAFSGGTLDGVTYQGTVDLTPRGSTLSIVDGVTLTGADGVSPGAFVVDDVGTVDIYGDQTLDNAFIDLQGGASGFDQFASPGSETGTLTLGSNLTLQIDGGGDFLNTDPNTNDPVGGGALVNNGTIQIDGPAFFVQATTLINAGILNSTTGFVTITATTFSNLGAADLGTGSVQFTVDAFSNQGTLVRDGAGYMSVDTGSFDSSGSFDTGGALFVQATTVNIAGTLSEGDGDYASFISDGPFSNAGSIGSGGYFQVQASDFANTGVITQVGDRTYLNVNVTGSASNTGTILTGAGWIQAADVSNTGEIDVSGDGYLSVTATTLTNTATATLSISSGGGMSFTIGTVDNEGLWSVGADSGNLVVTSSVFTNDGTIDGATGSGEIIIEDGTIINNGMIATTSDSSIVVLDPDVLTNAGEIVVGSTGYADARSFANLAGGTLIVDSGATLFADVSDDWSNAGSIEIATGGTMYLSVVDTVTTANLTGISNDGTIFASFTLDNTGQTLAIGSLTALGILELQGATIIGGVVQDNGAPALLQNVVLAGVTYWGTLDLSAASSSLTVSDDTGFVGADGTGPGTINFDGPAFQNSYLYVTGTDTLDNVTIDIGNGGYGQNYLINDDTDGSGAILTLGSNVVLDQVGGAVSLTSSDQSGDGIVNDGTILAGFGGATFTIDATNFTNDGSMVVSDGGFIDLTGVPTAALINSIARADGTVQIGGTVNGGTIDTPVGGAGGTLDGVTFQGTLDLSAAYSSLTLTDGTTLSGAGGTGAATINFSGPAFQNSYLYVLGTDTLDNATIDIGNAGYGQNDLVNEDTDGTGAILTLGSNLVLDQTGGGAVLSSSDRGDDGIVNDGTILADFAGGAFTIDAANFTNQSTIQVGSSGQMEVRQQLTNTGDVVVSGGRLQLDNGVTGGGTISVTAGGTLALMGTVTPADLSSIALSDGGAIEIDGVLDLTGTVLAIGDGTAIGTLALNNGTILNGVVQDSGNGLRPKGGYWNVLSGVTYEGTLTQPGGDLHIQNDTTFTGTGGTGAGSIAVSGGDAHFIVDPSQTVDNATISLGGTSGWDYLESYDGAGPAVLTLGPNLTIQQSGSLAQIDDTSGNSGSQIVNLGLIQAGTAGVTGAQFRVYGPSFDNRGSLTAGDGVWLYEDSGNFANDGRVTVTGDARLEVQNLFTNNTTVLVQKGELQLDSGITGTGVVAIGPSGTVYLPNGGSVAEIEALQAANQGDILVNGSFANTGATLLVSGGTVEFQNTLTNNGGVVIDGATLKLDNRLNGSGTISLTATGVLESGSNLLELGSATLGGTLAAAGGSLALIGTYAAASGETDTVTFQGAQFGWFGDGHATLSGPGTIASSGTVSVTDWFNGAVQLLLTGGVTWENSGTVYNGDAVQFGAAAGDAATIENEAGAVFDLNTGDSRITAINPGTYRFVNDGTLRKDNGGNDYVTVPVANTGLILSTGGLLELGGGSLGGTLEAAGGALALIGTYVAGGTDPVTFQNAQFGWFGDGYATMAGPGTIASNGTVNVTDWFSGAVQLLLTGGATWANAGTVYDRDVAKIGATATDVATIINQADALFDLADGDARVTTGGAGIFVNQGTLLQDGGGNDYVTAPLTNTGLVETTNGFLEVGDASLGGTFAAVGGNLVMVGTYAVAAGTTDSVTFRNARLGWNSDGYATLSGPGTVVSTGHLLVNDWTSGRVQAMLTGGVTWENFGTVSDGDVVQLGTAAGDAATLVNEAGAVFDLSTGDGRVTGTGTLVNEGTLLQDGGGNDYVTAPLTNTGLVETTNGFMELGGGTLGGTFTAAGGILAMIGTYAVAAGTTDSVTFQNARLGWNSDGFATLSGPGTVVSTGHLLVNDWTSGRVQALLTGGVTWENSGTLSNGDVIQIGTAAGDAATLVNEAGAIFDLSTGDGRVTGTGTLVNEGTLLQDGGGNDYVTAPLTNTGLVETTNGFMELGGGTLGGTFTAAGGILAMIGTYAVAAGTTDSVTFQNARLGWNSDGFATLSGPGTVVSTGTVLVNDWTSGRLQALLTGGIIWQNSGTVHDDDVVQLGSAMGDSATIVNEAGAVFDFGTNDGRITAVGTATFVNDGTLLQNVGGRTTIQAAILDQGSIDIASGGLQFEAGGTFAGVVNGGGALYLDGGTFDVSGTVAPGYLEVDTGLVVMQGGTIANTLSIVHGATITGQGSVAGSQNAGLIDASGGTLVIGGNVSGSGAFSIETGSTLELTGTAAQSVTFNGPLATLKLDNPSGYTGKLVNFGEADQVDLVNEIVSSTSIVGGTIVANLVAGGTLRFAASNAAAGLQLTLDSDGNGGTMLGLVAAQGATPRILTVEGTNNTITLPDAHVSATADDQETLSIENAATAPADGLNVGIGAFTGGAFASGTIASLGAGETDSSSISIGLNDFSAGAKTGTVALSYQTDGSVSHLPSDITAPTLTLTGNVFRYAAPSLDGTPNFIVHAGDGGGTVSLGLTIANVAAADGYSENLGASVTGFSTGGIGETGGGGDGIVDAGGSVAGLGPSGSDDTSLTVTVSTANTGTFTGDVTIAATSDGAGIDSLGTTDLGEIDVPVSVTVNNYATAAVELDGVGSNPIGALSGGGTIYTLDLGMIAGIGPDVLTGLNLANVAIGPADTLNAAISVAGDPAFMDALANGGTVSVDGGESLAFDTIDLSTTNTGTFSETLTIAETDTNSSGFSEVLPTQTVVVTGTIVPTEGLADPVVNNGSTLVLGDAHVGDFDQAALSITNAGTGTGFLAAGIGAIGGEAAGGGAIAGLAPGATDDSSITAGVDTSLDGARSGTVSLQFLSGDSTVAIGGGNLVVNGGFEDGDAGWDDGNAIAPSGQDGFPAHSGNQYLELGAVGGDAYTSQTLATQAGTEYAISLWYWASGQAPDDLNVSFGGDIVLSLVNPPQAGWTEYTVHDIASSDSTVLTIGARDDPAYDGVDDVSVVPVGATSGVLLPARTVTVQGNVFNEASPTVTAPDTVFLHVGDDGGLYTGALTVENDAPADGFSEALDATVTGVTEGAVSASGTVSGLAAGASDAGSLTFSVPTDFAGTYNNEIFVDAISDGTGIDSLGTTDLGGQGVPVSVSVLNYATAAIQTVGIAGGPVGTIGADGDTYTLDLGQIQAGSADGLAGLVLANTAIGPADTLNAVITRIGDAAFADSLVNAGTISVMAGQALTLDTIDLPPSALGTFTETLTVAETDTNSSGFSEVLPTQTVVVTGTVILGDVANPVINNGPTVVLPDVHVGSTDQTALSITNAATGAATLVAGINLVSGDATGAGFIPGLAPGATDDSSIEVGLNTANAGARSGTVSLQLVSDGTFISGGGGFNLVVNGGFENGTAGWTSSNGSSGSGFSGIPAHSGNDFLSLGAVGGDAFTTQTLATQVGEEYQISLWYWASGRYPDDLNVYFGSDHLVSLGDPAAAGWTEYTADAIATSGSTVLQIGGFNNPAYDGIDDVSVVATGTSATGSVRLPTQTVAVQGNVYREAAPSIGAPYNLYLHVGDDGGTYTGALTVANTAAADGYSEGLEATVTGVSFGSATASGTTGDIAAGQSDDTSFTVSQSTTNAGAYYSNVTVSETSDGTGVDNLGTTSLGTANVGVYILVDNHATAAVEQANNTAMLTGPTNIATVDLGTFQLNSGLVHDTLAIANLATGQADNLTGSVGASGDAAFSDTGLGAFGPVSAGSTSQFTVDMSTMNSGVFTQQIVVSPTGANNSGFAEALAGQTIVVTGTVAAATDTAVAVINTPTVIALPDSHVGDTASLQAVSISNAGSAGLYVLPNQLTGQAIASGLIQDLAPGGIDATDIAVGLDTSAAGGKSGAVTLGLVSLGDGSGGSGDDIVNNGDFENGGTGWSFSNAGIAGSGFAGMPAEHGNNLLYLAGGTGSATQVLNTVAGHEYQLRFWYDSTGTNPSTLVVSINGAPVVSVADAPASGWQEYTVAVPAVSNNTAITFAGGASNWYDGIDNVSVTDIGVGDVALASQTISVTRNVYRLAAPSVTLPTSPLVLHVGDGGGSVSVPISVANVDAADGFSEGVDASVVGVDSGAIALSTLSEVGSARMAGSDVQLTDAGGEAGAAWLAAPIAADQSFDTTFSFSMTSLGGTQADGLAFVIQGAGNNVVGSGGGGIGMSGLPGNTAAVVFQSWVNNRAGIVLNGNPSSAPQSLPLGNAQTVTGIVDLAYDAIAHELTLTSTEILDGVSHAVDQTVSVDLSSWIGQNLYLGFSAGTGGSDSNQEITGWNVTTAGSGGGSIGAAGATGDIAAGQTSTADLSATISTATAGSEIGAVRIAETSDGTGVDSLGLTNLGTVAVGVQATVVNYATAAITRVSGIGTLQGGGTAYTIDLGEVALGSAPVSLQLAVENAAAGPADLLEGGFGSASGDAAIQVSTSGFAGLGAGATAAVLRATLQTNTAGQFSEQVVLTGTGYNASGYSGILTPETITVTGTVAVLAHAALTTPGTIDFGQVHANSTQTAAIGIGNIATPPADSLDATAAASGGATVSGTIAGLAAGASDNSSITGGLATGSTGVVSGDIALSFTSNGVNGQVALSNQGTDVAVTGTVYALAAPVVTGTTLDFGATRVGGTVAARAVTIANGTTATPYQETLDYGLGNPLPSGFIAAGSVSGTAIAGGTAHATITLDTSASGDFSGTAEPLTLTSDGAGTSGLADTDLGDDTLTLNGKVYAPAVAAQSATSLDFGIVHAGATDIKTLSVTNTATGALTDVLTGGTGLISGGGFTGSGTLGAGLTAGASSGALSLALNTGTAGVFSATATLALASHDADLANLAVSATPIALIGTVYNYATVGVTDANTGTLTGSGTAYTLNLGTLAQGATASAAVVSLANIAAGLADTLSGTVAVSGGTSAFVNSGFGSVGTLSAGQISNQITIAPRTNAAGAFTETVTLTPVSTDPGGSTNLAPVTITVTGSIAAAVVYNLTTGVDTVNGNGGTNTIVATGSALSSGDNINSGAGSSNALTLKGAGTFNLGLPAMLTGIATVWAQEGQPAAVVNGVTVASTLQTVTLRAAENNVTVNVQPATPNPQNPSPTAITITGAANNDVINLGYGNDTVTPGAGETVNGGSGNATVMVTAATISDTIHGGSGTTKLSFSGGGTFALGANLTNLTSVYLAPAATAWNVTATTESGLVIQDASTTTTDRLVANGAVQTLTGGGAGKLTMQGAFDTVFQNTAVLFNGDTLGFAAGDVIDVTNLLPSGLTWNFTENAQNTGGTLNVLSGGVQKTAITLTGGVFSQSHFTVASDGGTGSAIGYHT